MSSVSIPIPMDITPFILNLLPSGLSQSTINLITNVVNNLSNEGITANEIFNFVIQALPGIRQFFTNISVASTIKSSFQGYTNIWLPFQYGVIIILVFVIMLILILTGFTGIFEGFILMIAFIALLIILGLIEFDLLAVFVANKETEFLNKFNQAFNSLAGTTLLNGSLGFVAGSQLTVNGPTGPGNVPLNGPIILTDSTSVFKLFPPSIKVTVFQTVPNLSNPQPEVFNVQLQELDQIIKEASIDISFNTVKPQYAKIVYIVNGNPPFSYSLLGGAGSTGTQGIVRIVNATPAQPAVGNLLVGTHIDQVPLSSLDPPFTAPDGLPQYSNPPQTGMGVNIYAGECKAFLNIGFNQPIPPTQTTGLPNLSFSTWVELTSDIRPLGSVVSSNSMNVNLRPLTKIVFVDVPNGANVDLTTSISTNVAVDSQELYIVANPPSGSINIVLNSGVTVLPKGNLIFLTFQNTQWVQNYP